MGSGVLGGFDVLQIGGLVVLFAGVLWWGFRPRRRPGRPDDDRNV